MVPVITDHFFSKRVLVIVGDHKNRPSIKSSDRNSGGRDGHKAAKGKEAECFKTFVVSHVLQKVNEHDVTTLNVRYSRM